MINSWNELITKLEEINKTIQDIQWAKIVYCHCMNVIENDMNIYFPVYGWTVAIFQWSV